MLQTFHSASTGVRVKWPKVLCISKLDKMTKMKAKRFDHSPAVILSGNAEVQYYKYEKHFQKMYRDVGMAVPKTTETRCRDGSMQARHVIQRLHN